MRGDGMPPRQPQRRGLLSGAPQAGRTLAPRGYQRSRDPDDPFAPYQGYGSSPRTPATAGPPLTGTMGRVPAVGTYTSTHVPALKHLRLGISIFHDGNPGHLWRGEFFSRLGEAVLSVGILMWLAALTYSPLVVAGAVVVLGLPFVLAGPLAARFENAEHPDRLLKWIGRLRAVLALSLVVMHFRTILPLLYAVLLALSFLGRIRDSLRIATIRTCLAPGEPEHVANDLHLGFSVASIAGPLLATFLYILNGERILLVSLGAVTFFALCANSETFLDALPQKRRAFLLATPDKDAVPEDDDQGGEETLNSPSPQERREHALAEWYQQGPTRPAEAASDLLAGFGLAGTGTASTVSLWATCALALVGGGLATLEVFYVLFRIRLPEFYLGPLIAAESAGLIFGIHLASLIMPRLWRLALFGGIAGAGVALVLMSWLPRMPIPLLLAVALGAANSLAIAGTRHALTDGFDGVERRALSAVEAWVAAICGVVGAIVFPIFYSGAFLLPHGQTARLPFRTYPIEQLLPLMGFALVAAAVLCAIASPILRRRRALVRGAASNLKGTRARLASLALKRRGSAAHEDEDDDWGETGASESLEAWDDEEDDRFAASASYDRDDSGWGETGYRDAAYDEDEGYDDPRGRSQSRAPRGGGSSARNRRERW